VATCASDVTILAVLTSVSPNWGPITLIRGLPRGSRVVPLDSTDMISY